VHDAKIKALRKLYQDQGRQPLIVACQFRHEISRIKEAFPEAKEFSQELLTDWNAGKIPLLLSHPASIGHGLNLQDGGSRVVWFSLDYSRELYDQMNARVARTGQTSVTKVFRLLSAGTVDDAVADAIRGKGENQSAFLQTLKNIQKLAA
jgi:SNF2 family DNA or RNA helicase